MMQIVSDSAYCLEAQNNLEQGKCTAHEIFNIPGMESESIFAAGRRENDKNLGKR